MGKSGAEEREGPVSIFNWWSPIMSSNVFCVTGWHFPPDFYRALSGQAAADFYILSHQPPAKIPEAVHRLVPPDQILHRSNIGYDWGCYQQFLSSKVWREYETVFFMHDDIAIKSFDFVERVNQLLKEHAVVGNGVGEGSVSSVRVRDRLPAYAHSSWKPDSLEFQHRTVRGSFFAASREALQQIGGFEVFWDPWKVSIEFGNWSTKATCGKMEAMFGPSCFGYLSSSFGQSRYITEFVRGEQGGAAQQIDGIRGLLYRMIQRASRVYMEILYREKKLPARWGWEAGLRLALGLFSRKLY